MYYLVFTAEIVNVSLCSKHNTNLMKKKKLFIGPIYIHILTFIV